MQLFLPTMTTTAPRNWQTLAEWMCCSSLAKETDIDQKTATHSCLVGYRLRGRWNVDRPMGRIQLATPNVSQDVCRLPSEVLA